MIKRDYLHEDTFVERFMCHVASNIEAPLVEADSFSVMMDVNKDGDYFIDQVKFFSEDEQELIVVDVATHDEMMQEVYASCFQEASDIVFRDQLDSLS